MLICGLKLTHDGSVAVIDGTHLRFSVELEKLSNNPRYSPLHDLDNAVRILASEGLTPDDIDAFVVDGWQSTDDRPHAALEVSAAGRGFTLTAAPYHEGVADRPAGHRYEFEGLELGGRSYPYTSYHHATDHLWSTYCTSPFAERGEPSLVLVWDAGMLPHLYRVDPAGPGVESLGPLFGLAGSAFAYLSFQFDPFWKDTTGMLDKEQVRLHLEIAGKAMAYAGLGRVVPEALTAFDRIWDSIATVSLETPDLIAERVRAERDTTFAGLSNADVIASYQEYLGRLLVTSLAKRLKRLGLTTPNLCMAGGCALNIKWNNGLRASGLFNDVWVPPFSNDSGVALGGACAEMIHRTGTTSLSWNVYSGPRLVSRDTVEGWAASPCTEEQLARLLHETGEPVTVLHGRAEIGPRALGHRSILAAPVSMRMKDRLNEIKGRAGYRPVAPVCLESRAQEIFDPGTPDPYMLFDHLIRPEWVPRIPAVRHIDGTARLQTVTHEQDAFLGRVLTEYERLSGVPLLCNTSANLNGRGFFPDAGSAMGWGGTAFVWADGILYQQVVTGVPATSEPVVAAGRS